MAAKIEIDFAGVPQIKGKFLSIDVEKETLGRFRRKAVWKKDADYIFTTIDGKYALSQVIKHIIPPTRIIADFMLYDYALDRFRNRKTWIDQMRALSSSGITKIVALDFSNYYETPDPIVAANMYHNLTRLAEAQAVGMTVMLNWNLITEGYHPVYLEKFPHDLGTIYMDDNHSIGSAILERETDKWREILDNFTVQGVIISSAKKSLDGHGALLRTLSRAAVPYVLIPSQTPLLFLGKSTK